MTSGAGSMLSGDSESEFPEEDPLISLYDSTSYSERKELMREWENRFRGRTHDG